jgi:hypothetical protein
MLCNGSYSTDLTLGLSVPVNVAAVHCRAQLRQSRSDQCMNTLMMCGLVQAVIEPGS